MQTNTLDRAIYCKRIMPIQFFILNTLVNLILIVSPTLCDDSVSNRTSSINVNRIIEDEMKNATNAINKPENSLMVFLHKTQEELILAKQEIETLKKLLQQTMETHRHEKFALYYNMGCAYKSAGDYKKAEYWFLNALAINPNDAYIHFNLGILYDDDIGNKKKARYHYQQFLQLAPDDKDAAKVRKWLASL